MKISRKKLSLYIVIILICVSVLAFSFINITDKEVAKASGTVYDGPITFNYLTDGPSGYSYANKYEETYSTSSTTVGTETITKAYLYKKANNIYSTMYTTCTKHEQGATTSINIGRRRPNLTEYIISIGDGDVEMIVDNANSAKELGLITVYAETNSYVSASNISPFIINSTIQDCYVKRDAKAKIIEYKLYLFNETRKITKKKDTYTITYTHTEEMQNFIGHDYLGALTTDDYTTTSI